MEVPARCQPAMEARRRLAARQHDAAGEWQLGAVDRLFDEAFVADRTENFEALRERVAAYDPERAAKICGVEAETIREVARVFGGLAPVPLAGLKARGDSRLSMAATIPEGVPRILGITCL